MVSTLSCLNDSYTDSYNTLMATMSQSDGEGTISLFVVLKKGYHLTDEHILLQFWTLLR